MPLKASFWEGCRSSTYISVSPRNIEYSLESTPQLHQICPLPTYTLTCTHTLTTNISISTHLHQGRANEQIISYCDRVRTFEFPNGMVVIHDIVVPLYQYQLLFLVNNNVCYVCPQVFTVQPSMSGEIDFDDIELAGLSADQLEELSEFMDPDVSLILKLKYLT